MKTFFILMAIVFLPAGWFLFRALRFTKETVGDDAPLHKERTYAFSATQYFGDFTKALLVISLVMMLIISYMMSEVAFRQEPLAAVFSMIFLAFAVFLGYYFYFDWQFWKITRDIILTMNPFQPSITVASSEHDKVITPNAVVRIEKHLIKVDNSKNPFSGYGYYLFYTEDNQVTRLNSIFFSHLGHFEFLERFFAHVPQTIVWHAFPWNPDFT